MKSLILKVLDMRKLIIFIVVVCDSVFLHIS